MSIEITNYKMSMQFDLCLNLANYVCYIYDSFMQTQPEPERIIKPVKPSIITDLEIDGFQARGDNNREIIDKLTDLQLNYVDKTSVIITKFYQIIEDETTDKNVIKNLYEQYQNLIISENYLDQLNNGLSSIKKIIDKLKRCDNFDEFLTKNDELNHTYFNTDKNINIFGSNDNELMPRTVFAKLKFDETINKILRLYDEHKFVLANKINNINECECGSTKINLYADRSEIMCVNCGCLHKIDGTVFEDNTNNNNTITTTKTKKYDYNKHCVKTLNQVLAQEPINLTDVDRDKIDARVVKDFNRGGITRPISGLSCRQLRRIFKDLGLSKLNANAPTIRKIITSLHGDAVIPPQPSTEEKEKILRYFSRAMSIYEELIKDPKILNQIGKKKIKNKPLYQYILMKILCNMFNRDPRLPGWIDCIHFQSQNTINKNDIFWRYICTRMPKKFKPTPTDRTILLRM